jgi:hypothetical protein
MTITRQYNLPNCSLILEGLEDASEENVDILSGESPMSILVNAECRFEGSEQILSGGSIFLENLARSISNYTQGLLSGFTHPPLEHTDYPRIKIEALADKHLHRIIVEPEPNSNELARSIDLTTVQLFDLVDAIDLLLADRSTLPHLSVPLKPLGRRYRRPDRPITERATPVVVGFGSLALAAALFFMIPPPETKKPEQQLNSIPGKTLNDPSKPQVPGTNPTPNNSQSK